MRWISCLAFAAAAALTSCTPRETKETHILHKGEPAQLICGARTPVLVAFAKPDIHLLAKAVEEKDEPALQNLIRQGRAAEVEPRTKVRVTAESYNERQIRIEEGPLTGRTVWVPFEWLRPV